MVVGTSGSSGKKRGTTKMASRMVIRPTGSSTLVSLHIFSWVAVQP